MSPSARGRAAPSRKPTGNRGNKALRISILDANCRAVDRTRPRRRRSQRLLALRLKRRSQSAAPDPWFPGGTLRQDALLRLFCLPHAGGGASAFGAWQDSLPASLSVCPVELPGRESRAGEPTLRDMPSLVEALGRAISPHTGQSFALFGHSMGAGVALELCRWLRRYRLPLPRVLVVSAARSPRERLGRPPARDPGRAGLVEELRQRGGIPEAVLQNPRLLRLILPPLEADAALYRSWVYEQDEPLPLPLRAYGGTADPHVTREQLEGWRAETSRSFEVRSFPGGHFYLRGQPAPFLAALAADLAQAVA